MIDHIDLTSGLVVLVMLGLGGALVEARSYRARRREADLREAIALLQMHYDALDALDDDETPTPMLELALDWNRIIHDPGSPALIAANREMLADTARPKHRPKTALSEAMEGLHQKRPDLVEAFIRSMLSGIEAFILRHPDCRPALNHLLLDLASAPAEESMRVVKLAGRKESRVDLAAAW